MKASELINLYDAGRRDFSGKCLRGQNFAEKDLSGANFRGCDIRGTNFTGAALTDADFNNATAGLQKRSMIGLLLAALLLASLSSFSNAVISYLVAFMLHDSGIQNQVAGWVSLGVLLIFCIISYWKGLGRGIGAIASVTAIATTSAVAIASILAFLSGFTGEVVKGGGIAFTGAFAGIISGVLAFAGVTVEVMAFALAEIIVLTFALALALTIASTFASVVAVAVGVGIAVALALLALFKEKSAIIFNKYPIIQKMEKLA